MTTTTHICSEITEISQLAPPFIYFFFKVLMQISVSATSHSKNQHAISLHGKILITLTLPEDERSLLARFPSILSG